MTWRRRTLGGSGVDPRFGDSSPRFGLIENPTLGLHSGIHYDELPPGFTPEARNFVVEAGGVTPRSGLSLVTQSSNQTAGFMGADEPVIGGQELRDSDQNQYAVAITPSSVFLARGEEGTWRELSGGGQSGTSFDYYETTYVYDSANDRNLAILVNGLNPPRYFAIEQGTASHSEFTFLDNAQGHSAPKAVTVADSRLIFANMASPKKVVNRIAWSVRGNPLSLSVVDGAGFQDLPEMRGQILRLVHDADGFVIFTSEEIWRAKARRDPSAFDFFPVSDRLAALNPRTAVQTPVGVMFVARDREAYVINGNRVIPIGQAERGQNSRLAQFLTDNMENPDRAWALYNEQKRRYEFYFTVSNEFAAEGFPTRALYYDLETDSWLPQRLTAEASYGYDFGTFGLTDLGDEWDGETTLQWSSNTSTWDLSTSVAGAADRRPTLFSSHGTVASFFDEEAVDYSDGIDVRWRSSGFRHPDSDEPHRRTWAWELWAEYKSEQASTVTVAWTEDGGDSFFEARSLSLPSSNYSAQRFPARAGGRGLQFEIRTEGDGPSFNRFTLRLKEGARE